MPRRSGGAYQPVFHRAESFQAELDMLAVVVVDIVIHARFEIMKAIKRCQVEILGL